MRILLFFGILVTFTNAWVNLLSYRAKRAVVGLLIPAIMAPVSVTNAADDLRTVGEFQSSGLVFKDTLKLRSISDPKVDGVTLYFGDFERPINEKLGGEFDPTFISLSCTKSGKAKATNINTEPSGEEVFEEQKGLFFKQTRIRRIFDASHNNVIYVSYSTRLDKGKDTNKSRFKSSTCVVHLD